MSFNLSHYSRYENSERITFGDVDTFGLYKRDNRLKNIKVEDLVNIKITPGLAGRPDLISEEYYNTPYYAWIIVMVNNPINPIGWPRQNDQILIPTPEAADDIVLGE